MLTDNYSSLKNAVLILQNKQLSFQPKLTFNYIANNKNRQARLKIYFYNLTQLQFKKITQFKIRKEKLFYFLRDVYLQFFCVIFKNKIIM